MNIMMSDSLSNRVKKETIERQIEESSFEKEMTGLKIISMKRKKDVISVVLQSDKQLLDYFHNYIIGLDDQIEINSNQLNIGSKEKIKYSVLSVKIDKSDKIKKIKLRLKVI